MYKRLSKLSNNDARVVKCLWKHKEIPFKFLEIGEGADGGSDDDISDVVENSSDDIRVIGAHEMRI